MTDNEAKNQTLGRMTQANLEHEIRQIKIENQNHRRDIEAMYRTWPDKGSASKSRWRARGYQPRPGAEGQIKRKTSPCGRGFIQRDVIHYTIDEVERSPRRYSKAQKLAYRQAIEDLARLRLTKATI